MRASEVITRLRRPTIKVERESHFRRLIGRRLRHVAGIVCQRGRGTHVCCPSRRRVGRCFIWGGARNENTLPFLIGIE